MSSIDFVNMYIEYFFGGYTVIMIGASGWFGRYLSTKIIHDHNKEIEVLKKELDVISHDKKNKLTRYDSKKASALENLHLGLVEFEISIRDVLELIRNDWKKFYIKSKEAVEIENKKINSVKVYTMSVDEFKEKQDKYVPISEYNKLADKTKVLVSQVAFHESIIAHIYSDTHLKWVLEIKKINEIILRNEIYLNEDTVSKSKKLVHMIESILRKSVFSIISIADQIDKNKQITEETDKKVRDSFNNILKECSELFDSIRKQITKEISIILEPK